jgi:hypothetical protein
MPVLYVMYSEHQLLTLGTPRSVCGNRPENRAGASLNSGAAKAFVGRLQSPTVRVASCRRFKPPYQVRYMEKSCSRRTQSSWTRGVPTRSYFAQKANPSSGLEWNRREALYCTHAGLRQPLLVHCLQSLAPLKQAMGMVSKASDPCPGCVRGTAGSSVLIRATAMACYAVVQSERLQTIKTD